MEREVSDEIFIEELLDLQKKAMEDMSCRVSKPQLLSIGKKLLDLALRKGHLVCTGIGKSGYVAQKLASTFSSLGLASYFLHPTEALHGDLGRINKEDILILFSKSGSTKELLELLPHLPMAPENIIGIIGAGRSNTQFPLKSACGEVVDASVDREICLYNLAPTNSTLVAMAIGDLLAIIFQKLYGNPKSDFAKNHPGGQLGKKLNYRIDQVMVRRENCACISKKSTLKEAMLAMIKNPVSLCAIVDHANNLEGILVEGDFKRILLHSDLNIDLEVDKVMNKTPVFIYPHSLVEDAIMLMENNAKKISVLPVVSEQKEFLGIIRYHEIFSV